MRRTVSFKWLALMLVIGSVGCIPSRQTNQLRFAMAAVNGKTEVVRETLAKGVDVNSQNGPIGPALNSAAYGGHIEIVEMLLDNGADVNIRQNHHGATPLMAAITRDQTQIVRILLDRGADVTIKTNPTELGEGVDALAFAKAKKNQEIIAMLEQAQPTQK